MQDQDLDQVRFVTRYYSALQGLKIVPFGLFMTLMSFRSLGWPVLGGEGDCTYTLPLLVLLIAGYYAIGRYYTRRFGEVQPVKEDGYWWKAMLPLFLLIAALVIENLLLPHFSLTGLLVAAMLFYSARVLRRPHYWAAGILMAVVSLLPLVVGSDPRNKIYGTMGFLWSLSLGLAWTVNGLIDHFMLVRSFKPLDGGSDARPE